MDLDLSWPLPDERRADLAAAWGIRPDQVEMTLRYLIAGVHVQAGLARCLQIRRYPEYDRYLYLCSQDRDPSVPWRCANRPRGWDTEQESRALATVWQDYLTGRRPWWSTEPSAA